MADKLRNEQNFEQLQSRFVGVGDPDTTREEWQRNVHRDSLASYVGHPAILEQFSIAYGEPSCRTRVKMIDKMVNPLKKTDENAKS